MAGPPTTVHQQAAATPELMPQMGDVRAVINLVTSGAAQGCGGAVPSLPSFAHWVVPTPPRQSSPPSPPAMPASVGCLLTRGWRIVIDEPFNVKLNPLAVITTIDCTCAPHLRHTVYISGVSGPISIPSSRIRSAVSVPSVQRCSGTFPSNLESRKASETPLLPALHRFSVRGRSARPRVCKRVESVGTALAP